jgi:hypothetical protein
MLAASPARQPPAALVIPVLRANTATDGGVPGENVAASQAVAKPPAVPEAQQQATDIFDEILR